MRKILFTVMAVTTLLYSCTKEEIRPNGKETKNANLKIQFSNLTPATRALDGDGDQQAAKLKNAMIFILGSKNDILSRHYFTESDILNPQNKPLPTTTSASHVWVLCNLGDSSVYGTTFNSCHTLAQLQNMTGKVEKINNGFANDGLGIWMVGSHDTALNFQPATPGSSTLEAKVVVNLSLIPSRIDVIVKNEMTNYVKNPASPDPNHVAFPASLQLKDVSIINSASENYLFPRISGSDTSYIPPYQQSGNYYASGLNPLTPEFNLISTNMKGIPIQGDSSNLYAVWDTFSSNDVFRKTFYALPGDTVSNGTEDVILLVRSERSIHRTSTLPTAPLDSIEPRYFHVAFNPNDVVGHRIDNGQYYTIEVVLKGNALTTGGGSTNPNVPVLNAFVEVTVKSGTWDKIAPIIKTFQ
ncbi:MAG: hypothetical protein LBQ73_11540 [Tannerellaceae bacterium]|jgi:hypothetical protein|nr:hypothetical protein [Tannerellaceae bacterium]